MSRDAVLKILKEYYDANRERYGIIRLGVFGSVARDEATEDSDVDVVVELVQPDLLVLGRIQYDLSELLGVSVDIVRQRGSLKQAFVEQIGRAHV